MQKVASEAAVSKDVGCLWAEVAQEVEVDVVDKKGKDPPIARKKILHLKVMLIVIRLQRKQLK